MRLRESAQFTWVVGLSTINYNNIKFEKKNSTLMQQYRPADAGNKPVMLTYELRAILHRS